MNTFYLESYKVVESKKTNLKYLVYKLSVNNVLSITLFTPYTEIMEQFLKNYISSNITDFVNFRFDSDIKAFVPYIKYQ